MKYLAVLVFSLLISGLASIAAADTITSTNPEEVARNSYYIAIHRPDGSCETVNVFANSPDEAKQLIKQQRCDSCVLTDVTASMSSGNPAVAASALRFCPML